MNSQLIFDWIGITSIGLYAFKELLSNWKGEFQKLKEKRKVAKVVFSTVSAIYNAITVIRGVIRFPGPVVYQGNRIAADVLFSFAAVLGVVVGAVEDYYKRYSCTKLPVKTAMATILCITISFAALFVAQGIRVLTTGDVDQFGQTTGIVMIAVPIVLSATVGTMAKFVNRTMLRISLLIEAAIVPGFIIWMLTALGGSGEHFTYHLEEFTIGIVTFIGYLFPIQILNELFVLVLISKQRQ
ncbi:hypothetical protein FGB62_117g025 [Gracilaria domingensis]|nr:hypothetical protein FGB62_117g025 [Gracilaria domingensis]